MVNQINVTVLTPTYNRNQTLEKLYKSLCSEREFVFEWLILDDGSTDDTERSINRWINEGLININYHKFLNGGKHRAINQGLEYIKGDIVVICDSDDYIRPGGLQQVIDQWQVHWNNEKVGLLVMERGYTNTQPIAEINDSKITDRYSYVVTGHFGEYTDAFRTTALQNFRFPEFEGEKFISESALYYPFGKKYATYVCAGIVIVGDYRSDGLTSNIRKIQIANPQGVRFEARQSFGNDTPFLFRLKKAALFQYVGIFNGISFIENWNTVSQKYLLILSYPMAWIKYVLDKKSIKDMEKKA